MEYTYFLSAFVTAGSMDHAYFLSVLDSSGESAAQIYSSICREND